MPENDRQFHHDGADAVVTNLAKLVADVARLAAAAERRRFDLEIGEGMQDRPHLVDTAALRAARVRVEDAETQLAIAVEALARGFAAPTGTRR